MKPLARLSLFALALVLAPPIAGCAPPGAAAGQGAEVWETFSAGPSDVVDVPAEAAVVIPFDDELHPGTLASDGIAEVCPGALIAAQATTLRGRVTLQAEAGRRGGPWVPFASGPVIPLHTVPDDARAVRVVARAGTQAAQLAGSADTPRPSYVTVVRACQQAPDVIDLAPADADGGHADQEPDVAGLTAPLSWPAAVVLVALVLMGPAILTSV